MTHDTSIKLDSGRHNLQAEVEMGGINCMKLIQENRACHNVNAPLFSSPDCKSLFKVEPEGLLLKQESIFSSRRIYAWVTYFLKLRFHRDKYKKEQNLIPISGTKKRKRNCTQAVANISHKDILITSWYHNQPKSCHTTTQVNHFDRLFGVEINCKQNKKPLDKYIAHASGLV